MLCPGSEVLSLSPLVVKMPGFASHAAECDILFKLSDDAQRSTIDNEQVTTSHRTSRTKWLDDDEVPARLSERAAMVSELPMSNAERWQLAQYGENCEYKLHVDTVPEFNDLAPGGRFLLYCYTSTNRRRGHDGLPRLGFTDTAGDGHGSVLSQRARAGLRPLCFGNARELVPRGRARAQGREAHRDALGPPRALPGRGACNYG